MTTPTLREAADTVEWMGEAYNDKPSIYCNSPAEIARWNNCVEHSKLAANTLRALASAQSDAEKGFEADIRALDGQSPATPSRYEGRRYRTTRAKQLGTAKDRDTRVFP